MNRSKDRKSNLLESAAVLEGLLGQSDQPIGEAYQCYKLSLRWAEVVGPTLGGVSKPVDLRDGRLRIHVKTASWLQQIQFSKRDILNALANRVPELKVSDLYFVIGS